MTDNKALDEKVNAMRKDLVTVVKALRDLSASVKKLEEKSENDENKELQEILKSQEMIDRIIVENSDSIKRLDREIAKLEKEKPKVDEPKEALETNEDEGRVDETIKKCRYYNKGYCKYEEKCKFAHPLQTCQKHLETLKCTVKECKDRHPKVCKWFTREVGCKRQHCDFLHDTPAGDDEKSKAHKESGYACEGCKKTFPEANYVVNHRIKSTEVFFCLNCEDWIQEKEKVFEKGWTLFDINGDLRRDV